MTVKFRFSPNFKKVLQKKEQVMRDAVVECVRRLSENPKHPGLSTHKMRGVSNVYEAYVDKGNRVTFHYDGDVMVFRNNCNHDILRKP